MGSFKDVSLVLKEKPILYLVAENGIVVEYDKKRVILNENVLKEMKTKLDKGYNVIVVSALGDAVFETILKIHKEKDLLPTGYNNVNPFDFDLSNDQSYVIGGNFYNANDLGAPDGLVVPIISPKIKIEEALEEIDFLKKENEDLKKKLEELKLLQSKTKREEDLI